MKLRPILLTLAALAVIGLLAAGAVFLGAFGTSVVSADVDKPLSEEEMAALAKRGAYVATVADCYACHTAPGGAPWTGGRAFATPFGTIYSTNISPDKERGIGGWSRADFHRALRDGVAKGGVHLYPAMPYTSYREMMPEDADAIYAWLMSRPPMAVANRKNGLPFPFNIRLSLTFWNLLNLSNETFETDPRRSDLWNRGRYIVEALAHCGECHTPRNALQAMEQDKFLRGAVIEGVEAPDITKEGLIGMGFDPHMLARFMKTGLSAQGSMTNQMFEVVHFSTQYMTGEDLDAMAAYLFDLDAIPEEPSAPPAPKPVEVSPELAASGRATYLNLCSGCHGARGEGIPHVAVPLATNASLRLSDPRNFLHTVLHGIPAQKFPGLERMQPMPSFAGKLDDRQVADLANWMRARWGGREPGVKPEGVAEIRNMASGPETPKASISIPGGK